MNGTIRTKLNDKGYGFITSQGKDYFFHHSQCVTPFEQMSIDDEVGFEIEHTPKGLRAVEVEKA